MEAEAEARSLEARSPEAVVGHGPLPLAPGSGVAAWWQMYRFGDMCTRRRSVRMVPVPVVARGGPVYKQTCVCVCVCTRHGLQEVLVQLVCVPASGVCVHTLAVCIISVAVFCVASDWQLHCGTSLPVSAGASATSGSATVSPARLSAAAVTP